MKKNLPSWRSCIASSQTILHTNYNHICHHTSRPHFPSSSLTSCMFLIGKLSPAEIGLWCSSQAERVSDHTQAIKNLHSCTDSCFDATAPHRKRYTGLEATIALRRRKQSNRPKVLANDTHLSERRSAQTLHVLSLISFSREDERLVIREHGFVILRGALDRKHIATV